MKTAFLRTAVICGVLVTTQLTSRANDIVDFLRAVNGVPQQHGRPVPQFVSERGHSEHGRSGYQHNSRVQASRDFHQPQTAGRHGDFDYDRGGYNRDGFGGMNGPHHGERISFREPVCSSRAYGSRPQARVTFNVSTGGYGNPAYMPVQQDQLLPPVDSYPVVPQAPAMPAPGYSYPIEHEIGQIVDCRVPLATCVRVEDECNIAPNAVPVVVAVRDPNACDHDPNAVVFVQVCVPPCPPRSIKISPCRTRVTMCYGQYEVDIKSKNGMIVVDYDN